MEVEKVGKKVAIVARAPASRYEAPFDDPSVEIWTLSPASDCKDWTDLKRWDRFYELHSMEFMEQECPGFPAWIAENKKKTPDKIWTQDKFPLSDMVEEFGVDYGTSSVAWMIQHAIYEKASWLGVFGCDMAHVSEYATQRPCVEFWLGYARGRGIEVVLPDSCDVVKHRQRYGFEKKRPMETRLVAREKELCAKVDQLQAMLDGNLRQAAATVGAQGEMEGVRAWFNGELSEEVVGKFETRGESFRNDVQKLHGQNREMTQNLHMLMGCLEELRYEMQWV